MPTSRMLRRAALLRTDISEERISSIIRVTRIGEIGTTLAVTNNRRTLTRATQRDISEAGILHNFSATNNSGETRFAMRVR
jgi:hypothetical protein